jgi:diketogulonate reductase-like aldo/keto reductase
MSGPAAAPSSVLTSHNGLTLPRVGFGTFRLDGQDGVEAIVAALDAGYRLLDSAVNYENEGAVGRAVRRSDVPREQVQVASKLPGRHHARKKARAALEESLYRTGLDRLDLYLIHWPNPKEDLYVEAWEALIEARDDGLVAAIGVCNFLPEHIERLQRETGELPAVNQIEVHPYFPQTAALDFHRRHGILTQAWTPIGRGNDLLANPVVTRIAGEIGATPAQVVLSWHQGRRTQPIPKAANPHRQRENLVQVELTPQQEERLSALGRADGRTSDQYPAHWQEF